MGMIRSKITVVDDINNFNASDTAGGEQKSDYKIPADEIAIAKIRTENNLLK